jgi:hypothetical protein
MSYQGARAQSVQDEHNRVFEVSKIRVDGDGRVTDVLWSEINTRTGTNTGASVPASADEVLDAIHGGARVAALFDGRKGPLPERYFQATKHSIGSETITLDGPAAAGRELSDMHTMDEPRPNPRPRRPRTKVYAVSQVQLDGDGRVLAVRWGTVNTTTNRWARPETTAPVAQAVLALQAGHRVFALFPALHGHVPEREFGLVDYQDGRQTIVLLGPTAFEREIHDMDRL